MKNILCAFCLSSALATAAFAETFKLPERHPAASFMVPDSWKPSETDAGIEAASADGEIYLSIEFADADNMNDLIDSTFAFLDKQGVKVEGKSLNKGESTLNGMSVTHMNYKAKDKDGTCEVAISFLALDDGKVLVITYWGATDAADKHKESLDKILGSIQKT